MKQWRQESLEEVRACMSRWLMEYLAWVEEIARPQLPGPTLATSSWPTRSSAHGLLW